MARLPIEDLTILPPSWRAKSSQSIAIEPSTRAPYRNWNDTKVTEKETSFTFHLRRYVASFLLSHPVIICCCWIMGREEYLDLKYINWLSFSDIHKTKDFFLYFKPSILIAKWVHSTYVPYIFKFHLSGLKGIRCKSGTGPPL